MGYRHIPNGVFWKIKLKKHPICPKLGAFCRKMVYRDGSQNHTFQGIEMVEILNSTLSIPVRIFLKNNPPPGAINMPWARWQCSSYFTPSYYTHCTFYGPFSYCINQAGLGAFTAKSGRKHYNPPPLTVMWMNFDSPNFPSLCSLSAIILFQTCSNKCILYVLSFLKCIKIKYKMVNMCGVFRD